MNNITRAIVFATKAHADRTCINSLTPYMAHVFDCFRTLLTTTSDESTLIALLVHDTLKYDTVSVDLIREHFGKEVAAILKPMMSIDKLDHPDQWPNKGIGMIEQITLQFIEEEANQQQLLLLAAIMIHNIQETQHAFFANEWPAFPDDEPVKENDELTGFDDAVKISPEKMASINYYNAIADAFSSRVSEFPELEELIFKLQGEAHWFLQY